MAEQIGRYQLIRLLGQGGMASVYLAHDPEFDRQVAIKVLAAQLAQNEQFFGRFRREAQTIAALEHPAIVPVYDFGQYDARPYLVMRYMPAGSLEEKLAGGRSLTIAQSAALFDRLAPALDEVHRRGIVHRDLKPGNILFDQNDLAYLSDFGIVKLGEGAAATLTAHGSTLGTPAYMSPEQARGEANLDSRSDIYSLGVILFQILTGEMPYRADTPVGMAVAHINDPVPDITATAPNLPGDTAILIQQAMAKDPAQRPQTAVILAHDLDRIAAGVPMSAAQLAQEETVIEPLYAAPAGSAVAGMQPPAVGPPTAAPPAKQSRRPRLTAILGCLGFLLLLGIVGIFAFTLYSQVNNPLTLDEDASTSPAPISQVVIEDTALPTEPAATATEVPPSNTPLPSPVPPVGSSNTYVQYIFDASGSMTEMLEGKTKLLIAQDVLTSRLKSLPPDINVGLRVYGHRLPWQDDEEASCRDIELVVPLAPGAGEQISDFFPGLQAQGMTPMTESIRQAAEDFTYSPERNNLIILLSDGIETCDEDPAEAVQFLQELGIDFTIHVIGLDVDDAAREQLQQLAAVAGGIYHDANSEADLNDALGDINDSVVQTALASASITETPTEASPSETPPPATDTIEPQTPTIAPSATLQPPAATFTPLSPTFTAVPPTATATTELPTVTAVPLPTDTPPPTVTAEPVKSSVNATYEGKISASSSYQGFSPALAVDGDRTTSWFSAGSAVDGQVSVYQWSLPQSELISSVTIISNAANKEPSFQTGFGFEAVTIQVLDDAGNIVHQESAGLGGTPDPNVTFNPSVKGSTVILNFSGHESAECGGFAELLVHVER